MSLPPGTRLGPYEVTAQIGQGGMGEVYRATDTHLKRAVAIKVLPASVAGDADRLARFQREAEVLAALNHPNIAGIHGLEKTPELTALVMELVEGDDLSQRIARGPLPLDEALAIAKQIAEALEAAHDAGIIHRDLKPANVKVRPDGTVKVLDFGLAKAMDQGSGIGEQGSGTLANSPTITSPAMTMHGMILGTAAYMSPEQAKGRVVDRRTDVFAFGCVLYEMLTGRRAFDGEDVTDVLGAVVRLEPDWTRLPGNCPSSVRRLLRLCLEKNLRNRRGSATDIRLDLEDALQGPAATTSTAAAAPRRAWLPWMVAAVLFVAAIGLAMPHFRTASPPAVMRFQVAPPAGISTRDAHLALSADGKYLAFAAGTDTGSVPELFIHSLETGDTRALPDTQRAQAPFWSPDGRFVGFMTNDQLRKVEARGGPVQTLTNIQTGATGTWNAAGTIVFSQRTGLFRISADGGTPTQLTSLDTSRGDLAHVTPHFLPDGNHFLYAVIAGTPADSGTYVGSLDGTPSVRILTGTRKAQFAPPNHLVFVRNEALFSQSFEPGNLRLSGEPVRLTETVALAPNVLTGRAGFSVAETGVMVVAAGQRATDTLDLGWYDRSGRRLTTVGQANYRGFELSPDGKSLAAHRHDDATGDGDIWVTDLEKGTERRFTFEPSQHASSPIWSPDGATIAFAALRNGKWGVYQKPSNGSGPDELLYESETHKIPMAWSPDGKTIVFMNYDPKTSSDLWLLPVSGDRTPTPYLQSASTESHPQISPDGRWIAYGSSGIWVQSYPTRGTTYQVASTGAQPRWRADGKELFFGAGLNTTDAPITAVDVAYDGPALTFGAPRALFPSQWANRPHPVSGGNSNYFTYAVSRDGQRFLVPRPPAGANPGGAPPMTVIVNWTTLLNRR